MLKELTLICSIVPNTFGIEPHMKECFSSPEKAKELLNMRFPEGIWICENTLFDKDTKSVYLLQKIMFRG